MHYLNLPWKILFATIPPTDYMNGWLCFIISIFFIGLLTAVIGDVAALFGCTIGLKDVVTAISFVAVGTSVPGKHLSKMPNKIFTFRHICFKTRYRSGSNRRCCNRECDRLKCRQRIFGHRNCMGYCFHLSLVARIYFPCSGRVTGRLISNVLNRIRILHYRAGFAQKASKNQGRIGWTKLYQILNGGLLRFHVVCLCSI